MSGYRFTLTKALICLSLLAACGPNPKERPFTPGPLEPLRLMDAAAAAGYIAGEMQTDIPANIRPRLQFNTLPFNDSLLTVLRDKYDLLGVIAGAKDEWQAQLKLNHWVHTRITNGTPTSEPQNALEILDLAALGKQFWCSYYAITYTQCALALGWQARKLGLDRYHPAEGKGSRHHGATEVWSNQFRKWVYIDPQSDLYFEKGGLPLSAWEIRGAWLKDKGQGVQHVVGVPPDTVLKNPAVVWWDLAAEDETALFFWLFYTDEYATWEKDSPSKFLFPQDSANAGLTWYQNDSGIKQSRLHSGYLNNLFLPTGRIEDVYWTVGVTEATLSGAAKRQLSLSLDSYCPDLDCYEVNLDGEGWKRAEDPAKVVWPLKKGLNSLTLRTKNRAGVTGPETSARMLLK